MSFLTILLIFIIIIIITIIIFKTHSLFSSSQNLKRRYPPSLVTTAHQVVVATVLCHSSSPSLSVRFISQAKSLFGCFSAHFFLFLAFWVNVSSWRSFVSLYLLQSSQVVRVPHPCKPRAFLSHVDLPN